LHRLIAGSDSLRDFSDAPGSAGMVFSVVSPTAGGGAGRVSPMPGVCAKAAPFKSNVTIATRARVIVHCTEQSSVRVRPRLTLSDDNASRFAARITR
jgi:hypothetical protein